MRRWWDTCTHAALPRIIRTLLSSSFPLPLIKIQDRLLCAAPILPTLKKEVIGTKIDDVRQGAWEVKLWVPSLSYCRGWQQVCSAGESAGSCEAFAGGEGNQLSPLRLTVDCLLLLAHH